ncbi:MAG: tRNA (adenosine(37)-N6)-threonylcarbamoyltransferase complex dimerization subunit type 1 TsaB [SAR202 cluster bacterium Io17-Chloro-G7]|nr:MAG: tRNA (adenosine(37)-N6)-threonylcarbamoyltransferase complex dimerization subunit type 1 TsaB [SAR202 cluster bacterium Io17-Chloro-G7]
MLLAVDTSTKYAGVALYSVPTSETGRVIASRCWYSSVNHTSELMPAVSQMLESQRVALADLTGIALALGPGGFSALRVGMSTVKGLAFILGIPVVGVGTLDLEAHPYARAKVPVCSILDAGRNEVASARFGGNGQRIRDDTVSTVPELLEELANLSTPSTGSHQTENSRTLLCGEGVINWGDFIRERMNSRAMVIEPSPATRLSSLCQLGWHKLGQGEVSDLVSLQPLYLRMPSIGGPKRRDQVPQSS